MNEGGSAREPDALRAAAGLLTVAPVGRVEDEGGNLGRSVGYFPLIGLGLGLLAASAGAAMLQVLPAWPAAVGVVGIFALCTGGLHLDGLSDTADGMGGGRGDRERTLAIMRDSRLGSYGAIALTLAMLGKITALAEMFGAEQGGGGSPLWAVALMPVAGRWGAVLLVRAFPYARREGLGRRFHEDSGTREAALATATALAAVLLLGDGALLPLLAAGGAALAVGAWVGRRLGGLTGDVYGAGIEIGEAVFLWMWLIRHPG